MNYISMPPDVPPTERALHRDFTASRRSRLTAALEKSGVFY